MGRLLARLAAVGLLVAGVALVGATPAVAKMWPFTVEVAPERPTAGIAFRVTVRCWHDLDHMDRARCPSIGSWLDGFLWAVPAGSGSPEADALPVGFVRRGGDLRASLVLPTPGRWYLCVWAPTPCDAEGDPGYPSRLDVLALERPAPTTSPDAEAPPRVASGSGGDGGSPAPVAAAAVVAVVLAGALGVRRSRRR
jgi:hypothetical protein